MRIISKGNKAKIRTCKECGCEFEFDDKEKEFASFGNTIPRPLSEYSTTELKAELRRRKNERRR